MAIDFRRLVMEEAAASQKEETKIAQSRQKALADPSIADKRIASYLKEQIPAGAKVKKARYANETDAVSSFFQEDDPRRDLGDRIKKSYNKLLTDPNFADLDPDEGLNIATRVEQERHKTATFEHIRRANAPFLGFSAGVGEAPGYQEWKEGKRAEEDITASEREAAGFIAGAPERATIGAAFAGAGLAVSNTARGRAVAQSAAKGADYLAKKVGSKIFSKVAARGLMAAPHPLAKIAGAALFATADLFVMDKALELVDDTEWGRANVGTKKKLAADLVLGLASGVATHKAVTGIAKKSMVAAMEKGMLSKQATQMLGKLPTGENAINAFKAQRASRVATARSKGLNAGKGIKEAVEEEHRTMLAQSLKEAEERGIVEDIAAADVATARRLAPKDTVEGKRAARLAGELIDEAEVGQVARDRIRIEQQRTLAAKKVKDLSDDEVGQQVAWMKEELERAGGIKEKKLTVAGIQKRLTALQKEGETRLAKHLKAIDEENIPVVQDKIAKGKSASVAAKEVADEEKLIVKVAKETPAAAIAKKKVEKKLSPVAQKKLTEQKLKWAAQTKKEITAVEAKVAAEKITTKTIEQSKHEIAVNLRNQARREGIATGAERAETTVVFGKDNPPPIIAFRKSKQTAEDLATYQAAVERPGVQAAQSDVVRGLNSEEWTAFEKRANTLVAEGKAKQGLAEGTLTEKETVFAETSKVDEDAGNTITLYRGTSSGGLEPREGYATFASSSKEVAASYGDTIPFEVNTKNVIEFPVTKSKRSKGNEFDKFAFDEAATKLKSGQVLVARNVYDPGPLADDIADPDRLYSYASDIYAFPKGADLKPKVFTKGGKKLAEMSDDEVEAVIAKELEGKVPGVSEVSDVTEGVVAGATEVVSTKTGKRVIKRKSSKTASIAALAGAGTLSMLLAEGIAPQEAEAGVVGSLAGFLAKQTENILKAEGKQVTRAAMSKKAVEEGFVHGVEKSPFELLPKLKTLSIAPAEASIKSTDRMALGLDHLLSPKSVEGHHYVDGHGPVIELVSRTTASFNDAAHGMTRVNNILDEVPGAVGAEAKAAAKDIAKVMKPVDDAMMPLVNERGYFTAEINRATKDMKKYLKKAKAGDAEAVVNVELFETQITKAKAALTGTDDAFAAAQGQWESTVKGLAEKYPTTRIALAVEDTAEFEAYPWLRGKLSHQENVAVARLKEINREYASRIEEVGMKAITEKDFIHHAQHPMRDQDAIGKTFDKLGVSRDAAASMSNLHHRSVGSKLMMPDVEYVFARYLPDVNKRIQFHDFWENSGWRKHMEESAMVKSSQGLTDFWIKLKRSFDMPSNSKTDQWANRYNSIEVFRLLALSPSVAFKHAIKVTATLASHDIGVATRAIPTALRYSMKNALKEHGPKNLAKKITFTEEEQAIKAFTRQSSYLETVADLELNRVPTQAFDKLLSTMNQKASVFIDTVEQFDRGVSYLASMEMAGKRGMTVEQATYGVFDTILKNNFLGGQQNPAWMRNPKVRSFFMFQSTPFKIWERRLNQIMRSGKALSRAQQEVWTQMKDIKKNMKEGEQLFKAGLIKAALESEKDHFGTPVTKQLMKEMLILGALVTGANKLGDVDLTSHAFHLPFLKMNTAEPGLVMNPALSATYKTWQDKDVEEDEFFFNRLMRNWSRDSGLPSTVVKGMRLSRGDIPERYLDTKNPALAYMFGAPAVGSGH